MLFRYEQFLKCCSDSPARTQQGCVDTVTKGTECGKVKRSDCCGSMIREVDIMRASCYHDEIMLEWNEGRRRRCCCCSCCQSLALVLEITNIGDKRGGGTCGSIVPYVYSLHVLVLGETEGDRRSGNNGSHASMQHAHIAVYWYLILVLVPR